MLKGKFWFWLTALIIVVLWSSVSCRNEWEDFDTSSNVHLGFSADTVSFDTVFTTIPTVTKWVMVRNTGNKRIKISRIYLEEVEKGLKSAFRLNVDGDTSLFANDVVVAEHDSFYIFITANIQYLKSTFAEVSDNVVFEINGKKQRLALKAWGQNAYYHFPTAEYKRVLGEGDTQIIRYLEFPAGKVLENDKPHVFFGYAAVSAGGGLTAPAGTSLYFADGSGIWVRGGSSINVQGTYTSPVLFTSLRQDHSYKTMAGQWEGLWFDAESVDNQINYAIIRNAKNGVYVDSSTVTSLAYYALEMTNTRIENMTRSGIFSRKNYIKGINLVVGNCVTAVSLIHGGGGVFAHCTFTNYNSSTDGIYSLVLNDYEGEQSNPFTSVEFINCIIFGRTNDQINFDLKSSNETLDGDLPYLFDHCVTGTTVNNNRFISCLRTDPLFKGEREGDFEISSDKSSAVKAGSTTYSDPLAYRDIKNQLRIMPPTIGAYEFVKPTNP